MYYRNHGASQRVNPEEKLHPDRLHYHTQILLSALEIPSMEEKVLQHRYPGQNSMRDVDNRVLGYTYQPNFSILRLQMKQQPSPADEDTTKTPGSSDEKVRKHPFCDVLAMFII